VERLTKIAPGLFIFDFGREIQGGLRLSLKTSVPLNVTVRFGEELLRDTTSGVSPCVTNSSDEIGRVCYNMRTGSRYEDVWTFDRSATIRNHEYIEGRYGELFFNETDVSIDSLTLGAWTVKASYNKAKS